MACKARPRGRSARNPLGLTEREVALLAAVLSNPKVLKAKNPSPCVRQRMRWIAAQMRQLGGVGYLREL
ncbi:MAG: hypothetical protein HY885_05665 [Deltaproteobacteria bacterium]|nr:hypothetical protein [Deltaproteobacteria bacterium]